MTLLTSTGIPCTYGVSYVATRVDYQCSSEGGRVPSFRKSLDVEVRYCSCLDLGSIGTLSPFGLAMMGS